MGRSKWKGPYLNIENLTTLTDENFKKTTILAARNSVIIPAFIGLTFKIHNGKNFLELIVSEDMVGHKFGEFVFTRGKFSFKKKKK